MVRIFLIGAALLFSFQARSASVREARNANVNATQISQRQIQAMTNAVTHAVIQQMTSETVMSGIFTVGDSDDYNMNMGFITGTSHMFVKQQVTQGYWVETDINLSMLGKQKIDVLYSPAGQILKLLVNGQPQTPPNPGNEKIVAMHKATVTVPKGTFVCMYIKVHDTAKNTNSQIWINHGVPVGGMVQEIAPSGILGNVTMQLINFVTQ